MGGYLAVHARPPAFEAPDGHPYTVSIEVESTGDLRAPYAGYLVFPQWAETGLGIIGHVETPILWRGGTRDGVVAEAGAISLRRVKDLLDDSVARRHAVGEAEGPGASEGESPERA